MSAASLSYWRNGRREPDRDSLYRISVYFAVDPWEIMTASARDFLVVMADQEKRFDEVERQVVDGTALEALEGWSIEGGALVMSNRRGSATMRKRKQSVDDLTGRLTHELAALERGRSPEPDAETVSNPAADLMKEPRRKRELRKLQAVRDEGENSRKCPFCR